MGTEARLLRRIKDFTTGSDLGEWIAKGVESRKGISGLTIVKALEGLDYGISACCLHLGNVDVEASAEDLEAVSGVPEYSVEPNMKVEEIAEIAVLIATLPPHMLYLLEAIVLPVKQAYMRHG